MRMVTRYHVYLKFRIGLTRLDIKVRKSVSEDITSRYP